MSYRNFVLTNIYVLIKCIWNNQIVKKNIDYDYSKAPLLAYTDIIGRSRITHDYETTVKKGIQYSHKCHQHFKVYKMHLIKTIIL